MPPTHEPYLPLLPSRKASPPFGWYSLRLPTKVWPGWVDLGGWSHTEINVPHRELNPDTVTHLSTNRARRWLTSLIKANALTTTPDHQWCGNGMKHQHFLGRLDTIHHFFPEKRHILRPSSVDFSRCSTPPTDWCIDLPGMNTSHRRCETFTGCGLRNLWRTATFNRFIYLLIVTTVYMLQNIKV